VRLEIELTDAQLAAIAERVAELVTNGPERWLSQKELAEHFGCSVRTVLTWQKQGLPCLRVGSHPRFKASTCETWLSGRLHGDLTESTGSSKLPRVINREGV
jgi:excisionase family DNA binding protein